MHNNKVLVATTTVVATLLAGFIACLWAFSVNTPTGKFDLEMGWNSLTEKTGGGLAIIATVIVAIIGLVVTLSVNRSNGRTHHVIFVIALIVLLVSAFVLSRLFDDMPDTDSQVLRPIIGLIVVLTGIGGTAFATITSLTSKKANK